MLSKRVLKFLAITYLPILRFLEKLHLHYYRQNYPIGFIKGRDINKAKGLLIKKGYEKDIFAWKDPGEIISMRKMDGDLFNYHIRIFNDGEVRGHYEYASESKPLKHIFESCFIPKKSYFRALLRKYLVK